MSLPSIQIYILSRDRPEYLREAVTSAINQSKGAFELDVIVSDNSETDRVKDMMAIEFPEVHYIRRWPATSGEAHYKSLISESTGDYVVLFHDDDVLLPEYCTQIVRAFEKYPEASAIACNAIKIDETGIAFGICHTHAENKYITDEQWLLSQYISKWDSAPFPSYCYKRSCLDVSHLNARDGGKYADVSFIAKKLSFGPIVWLANSYMKYRRHGKNDSGVLVIEDYVKLWRYMVAKGLNKRLAPFSVWRKDLWFEWYVIKHGGYSSNSPIIPQSWRDKKVQQYYLRAKITKPFRTYMRMLVGYAWYVFCKSRPKCINY